MRTDSQFQSLSQAEALTSKFYEKIKKSDLNKLSVNSRIQQRTDPFQQSFKTLGFNTTKLSSKVPASDLEQLYSSTIVSGLTAELKP
jgi:hypothetical protein